MVVSAYGSFHGRTLATLAATGQPAKHEPFFPMPDGFRHVAYGDLDALGRGDRSLGGGGAHRDGAGRGRSRAGRCPSTSAASAALCDERGMLMMVDEVQTGFGRTGQWFGFQHAGVRPDVVTMAKAMGNGFPVGATWARTEVAAAFRPGDHGSTYSGTAIATAVVSAVIAEMRRIDAPALAAERGRYLRAGLERLDGVASGTRSGSAARRRARGRPRRQGRVHAAAGRWSGDQRCHRDRAAIRPAAHGHRRRDRRGVGHGRRGADVHRLRARRCAALPRRRRSDRSELDAVLQLSAAPIATLGRPLDGQGAALIFEKPSNRTRQSIEMAVVQLGGHPIYTRGEEVGFDVRETVEDVAHIMSGYHAVLAARVFDHTVVERLAAVSSVPVVNMLSDQVIRCRRSPTC